MYRKESRFSGTTLYIKGDGKDDKEVMEDITGYTCITDEYKDRDMRADVLKCFLKCMSKEGRSLEEGGEDLNDWILEPECIFISTKESDNERIIRFFCYHNDSQKKPDTEEDTLKSRLEYLFEFILRHTDHEDDEAVRIAYDAYMRVTRGNYVFDDLWSEQAGCVELL